MAFEMNPHQFANSYHILMTTTSLLFLLSTKVNRTKFIFTVFMYSETGFFWTWNVNVGLLVSKGLLLNFGCLNVLWAICNTTETKHQSCHTGINLIPIPGLVSILFIFGLIHQLLSCSCFLPSVMLCCMS